MSKRASDERVSERCGKKSSVVGWSGVKRGSGVEKGGSVESEERVRNSR